MNEQTVDIEKRELDLATASESNEIKRFYTPRVDIYEVDDSVIMLVDMPGVEESDVDISLEKSILTIRGEVQPTHFEDYEIAYREYLVGNYERTFALSDEVNRDEIEATMKNGVLHLIMPKVEEAKARKITVKSA